MDVPQAEAKMGAASPLVHRKGEDEGLQWVDGATGGEEETVHAMGARQRLARVFFMGKGAMETSWRGMRPWREFADKTKFTTTSKMDALNRAKVNLIYFKSNYTLLMAILTVWTILSNIAFALSMGVSALSWKVYFEFSNGGSNTINLPTNKQLRPIEAYISLSFFTLFLFYMTGGSSTIFWLVTTCLLVIVGHATLREAAATPAELALEELSRPEDTPDWV